MTVPPGSKFVRLDAFTAWLSKAAQGLPEPVELSEDVKEYLREGMENATGGEDDDVDYDFANGLEQLLHPLVRLDACTQVVAGMAARNAELEAEVERSEKHRNDLADTIVSQRTDIGALRAKNAELVGLLRKAWRGPRTDEDCEAIDAALADDTLSPNTPA
ncbi:hypothetical protein [Pseudomonas massiliensis]|uniref:hypothetical protein n=1 Tax=Pseudomonas massiliensis TaxID=522492 RepID=UPI00058EFF24|nr:hypothetical protein [Pseudomonas massiliensis]